MSHARTVLPFLVLFSLALPAAARADAYRLDQARTQIAFEVGAKGYPLTHGVFRRFSSSLNIDFDHPQQSSVNFTVGAGSLDTHAAVLDAYIRSPVFLDADRHPEIHFASTEVRKLDERTVAVTGDLTLLGVTQKETFTVAVSRAADGALDLQAEGAIKRSQFGMTGGLPLVSDDVRIIVDARADAPADAQ